MDNTPDVSTIAALIGDRTRAAMLMSLMEGRALTATELARSAEITKQTASSHLAKLSEAQLVVLERVGRHHYFRLADHHVAQVIELLSNLAGRIGATTVATGPSDVAMRRARACYDHLAGELGVLMFDSLKQRRIIHATASSIALTDEGEHFLNKAGVDMREVRMTRRPLCLACLDWSVRRHHLAGAVGAQLLTLCLTRKWARRAKDSRAIVFSAQGEMAFRKLFPYKPPTRKDNPERD